MIMSGKTDSIFDNNVPGSTEILRRAVVGIAGCGGLGANAAVSLARAGAGKLILADHDRVEASNLNRQPYFRSDIGKAKTAALAAHIREIAPEIELILHEIELTPEDIPVIFKEADILIEAFDRAENKKWLIEAWTSSFPDRDIVVGSGLAGLGRTNELAVRSAGKIHFCGDGKSEASMGLCSARVAIVANMEANVAIEILTKNGER